MKHRLLILGTLGEFVQLVRKAREKGYYTIVCDGYSDGPAREFADEAYQIPVTDTEKIAELCREKEIDGIITSFSDLLLECMVKIADRAGLPCYLKPEQLPWYRDKSRTRELLQELGLPTPGFQKIPTAVLKDPDRKLRLKELLKGLRYPVVSKPLDKYGSRGIYISENLEELIKAAEKTAEFSDMPEILVEEYNDGYEFNMMTWVRNGKVHVISIADREKTSVAKGEIPISTRNVYPSRLMSEVEKPATELLQAYVEKTGQKEGALSMQLFWKPGEGIQVCEIAARFFGYEHELTDMVYGFNMEEFLLASLYDQEKLDRILEEHNVHKPQCCGAVIYFQGRLLTIADQSAAVQLGQKKEVQKPWIFYEEGETVIEHGPNPYLALYYVKTENRQEMDRLTQEFYRDMHILDPSGKEVAYQNQIPDYTPAEK